MTQVADEPIANDAALDSRYRYVVVEGPIGVGKTTLALKLAASLGGSPFLEMPAENPFLERFYDNPRAYGLSTQLSFLVQRARQVEELRQDDLFSPLRVADFMVQKDRLFAELTLDDQEFELYRQVYDRIMDEPPQPDLVIYLQAPVDVLQERIARRGLDYEQGMDARYLLRVSEAYTRYFFGFDSAPVIIVNAAEIDLPGNEADYNVLLKRIMALKSGRHYFNPLPFGQHAEPIE